MITLGSGDQVEEHVEDYLDDQHEVQEEGHRLPVGDLQRHPAVAGGVFCVLRKWRAF